MKHFETQIKDFSQQFTDQVKCLDSKVTVDTNILGNILDLYKRRAAIEQEYSDNLLKLTTSISQRNNVDQTKKLNWKNYSPTTILNSLLASTQYTAKAHRNLADIYGKQITQRIIDMQEDCTRLTKKSTDILQKHHAEILRSLNQLLAKQKLYAKTFNEAEEAKKRADRAMEQLDREVVRSQDKKKELDKNPRIKRLKDEYIEKYTQFKGKYTNCTTARNKYVIHLLSLKDTIDYFYSNELKTVVECSEYGFHNNLTRLCMNHTSCEEALITVHESINKLFTDTIDKIDANNDTQVFMEAYKSIWTLKEKLQFTPFKDDNINKIINSEESVQNCLQNMYVRFNTEMSLVMKKVEKDKTSIDSLSRKLNDLINQNDYDVVDYICHRSQPESTSIKERSTSLPRNGVSDTSYTSMQKLVKENKMKTEMNYFQEMEIYLSDEINKVNMATKLKSVESALDKKDDEIEQESLQLAYKDIQTSTAVIIGMKSKLFGGDLTRYSKETNEVVPIIVQSCIRLINLYGMKNMGVFRVPGSQVDILNYKVLFELGQDPLKSLKGTTNDVNLAASLLKLYFRELDPPIFDEVMFYRIVNNYNLVKRNEDSVVSFMKEFISTLSSSAYATLKYLLTFISHLAEFSSENCMDILNLAIIFGPCLMPIPEDKSSQLYHFQTIVNHVVQCLISHHDTVFSQTSTGPTYQRVPQILKSPEHSTLNTNTSVATKDIREDSTSSLDEDSDKYCDFVAVAVADYKAKDDHELSFSSGDNLILKKRINDNWWNGHFGKMVDQSNSVRTLLIPNEFINICNQNEYSQLKDFNLSPTSINKLDNKESYKSLTSIDSENDISPDDNRSFSQSMENPVDFLGLNESKSCASLEDITGDDEDNIIYSGKEPPQIKQNEEIENESVHGNSVKIRESRSSITIYPDFMETTNDTWDEEIQQTLRGLKKIEELNVIRHRNTVHIDKSLLTSKFISPLNSDHVINFDCKSVFPPHYAQMLAPTYNDNIRPEFRVKKPGNSTEILSSFDLSHCTKPPLPVKSVDAIVNQSLNVRSNSAESVNVPPPTYPKPKLLKK